MNNELVSRINDIEYYYTIILFNNNGDGLPITQSAIKTLKIVDDYDSYFESGEIIIDNKLNVLNRKFTNDIGETNLNFNFNKSDNDFIYVEIMPKLADIQSKDELKETIWNLSNTYVIYDIEYLESENFESRYVKLYFWDYKKYLFTEKNIEFSTATIKKGNTPASKRTDTERQVKTGIAIQELIKKVVSPNQKFSENWDEGKNEIFYTASAQDKGLDVLNYLYTRHISEKNSDRCALYFDRSQDMWMLESLTDVFDKALDGNTKSGEYMLETFSIAEPEQENVIPKPIRSPEDHRFEKNIYLSDYSKLDRYNLIDISKLNYMSLNTCIGHGYDFKSGKFKIEHYDVSDTKEFFKNNYSNKLKFNNLVNFDTFKLDTLRIENLNVKNSYAPVNSTETLEFFTRNRVLWAALNTNIALEFTQIGATYRTSGVFFNVRKDNDYESSDYENKLQGQWFCVKVEHIFQESQYRNNILAVKANTLGESAN